mmetsp:Transcript_10478/g.24408  ORF Transcript_10478/g.24408 Transcript_10478/m.24408 type:complete len:592 (+) Transcript_10478:236-2011(+)
MKRSVSSHHAASRGSADSMFHSLIDDTASPMGQGFHRALSSAAAETTLKRSSGVADLVAMAAEAAPMFASRSDARGGGFQKAFSDELLHAYVLGGDGNESDGDSGDDMGVGVGLDLDDDWNGQAESPFPAVDWLLKRPRPTTADDTGSLSSASTSTGSLSNSFSSSASLGNLYGAADAHAGMPPLTGVVRRDASAEQDVGQAPKRSRKSGPSPNAVAATAAAMSSIATSSSSSFSSSASSSSHTATHIASTASPRTSAKQLVPARIPADPITVHDTPATSIADGRGVPPELRYSGGRGVPPEFVQTSYPITLPTSKSNLSIPVLALNHPSVKQKAKASAKQNVHRKEVFINSLKTQIEQLWDENQKLKVMVAQHLPQEVSDPLLQGCISEQPSVLKDDEHAAIVRDMDKPDSTLIAVLQEAQRSYVITDPNQLDNPITWVSPNFCTLTGYHRDEIIGRNCRFLQGPATDPKVVAKIREAVEGEYPETFCIINYKKDGTPFWNNLYMSPLFDRDKKVTHFIGVQCDVSAAKPPMDIGDTLERDRIPVEFKGGPETEPSIRSSRGSHGALAAAASVTATHSHEALPNLAAAQS